ncbi:MAG: hypothetical protein V2I63_08410 [Pseudomonadales bacterium]|jgi:hypothetical protein|nr:hypothetical protein [Pseudomonadales bacterium]
MSLRRFILLAFALPGLLAPSLVLADAEIDAYVDGWGPALGAAAPAVDALDQTGTPHTLASLTGDRGLLLVFVRSADW